MGLLRSRPTRAFRSVIRELPGITVPDAIPDYDGLLPITVLDSDLRVTLPWWEGVQPLMRLQAGWKLFDPANPSEPEEKDLVGEFTEVSAAEAGDPSSVFTILVPTALLTHGVYLLSVRSQSVPGNDQVWTVAIRVEVDKVAPGGGAFPLVTFYPPVETSKTITDGDIVDGMLPGAFAHYEGIASGDEVVPIINGIPQVDESYTVPRPTPIEDFIPIYFNEAALLTLNNTEVTLKYSVKDKAGNQAESRDQFFSVDLRSNPENLLAPRVPRGDDGLVDDADARAPVQVNIPKFDKGRAKDSIVVHWGNQIADAVELKEEDLENDPMVGVQLPYDLIFQAGNGTIQVKYEVFRGGNPVGLSPEKSVVVDLTLIGGPDDPETPVHENLKPATIFSDSGDGDENNIPPEDYAAPARAVIPWLAKDGTEIYAENDEIRLTWGDQAATPVVRTVASEDVENKVDLLVDVPASTIGNQGSGVIPVFYTASRVTSVPPSRNISLAPSQEVTVTNADDLPGGGTLGEPSFPVLNMFEAIGPNELIDGPEGLHNPVRVATDYTHANVGDTIELFFVGYDELNGGNQIPDAAYNPQPPYALVQADLDRGYYEFRVPAQYHYAVCSQGAVEAHVIIRNTYGPTTSAKKRVYCDVKPIGAEDCEACLLRK